MSELININICISDIPEAKINIGKNGKNYVNLVLNENRNGEDNYGNTHNLSIPRTKEERDLKSEIVFVGRGKRFVFENAKVVKTNCPPNNVAQGWDAINSNFNNNDDDLPF